MPEQDILNTQLAFEAILPDAEVVLADHTHLGPN